MAVGSTETVRTDLVLADEVVTVQRTGDTADLVVQAFAGPVGSLFGIVWLRRALAALAPADREVLQRHLALPIALARSDRGLPVGWLVPAPPGAMLDADGRGRTLTGIGAGRRGRIRPVLALADQLAAITEVLDRCAITGVDLAPSRILVSDDEPPLVYGFLGPGTRVDGVPLLLEAPTAASGNSVALARVIEHLLPAEVRDHPTLRDLETLDRCCLAHDLPLPPALWRTAIGSAMAVLNAPRVASIVDLDRRCTHGPPAEPGHRAAVIDLRGEPAVIVLDETPPIAVPTVEAGHDGGASSDTDEPDTATSTPAGLTGLRPTDLLAPRAAEITVLAALAALIVVLTVVASGLG